MQTASFFGGISWSDLFSIINPFDKQTTRQIDNVRYFDQEVEVWNNMVSSLIGCLETYELNVKCVSGEANAILYNSDVYKKVKTLSQKHPDKKIAMVAGPIIMTNNKQSCIIELFKNNLVDLYFSPFRRSIHFRIGGRKEDTIRKLFLEQPHNIGEQGFRRRSILVTSVDNGDVVTKYENYFDRILSESKKISSLQEANDHFLFIENNDIKKIRRFVIDTYGEEAYSPKEEQARNKDFYVNLMKKLKITSLKYN